jgi:TIR domain-containing protein
MTTLLRGLGFTVYVAIQDYQPGSRVTDKIEKELLDSDAMVVLLTRNGWATPWVQQEIGIARAGKKLILPIVDAALDHGQLGFLGEIESVPLDIRDGDNLVFLIAIAALIGIAWRRGKS